MKVREAVTAGKGYIQDIFGDENIANLGLEEVEFDETTNTWTITLGFSRPWDKPAGALARLEGVGVDLRPWRREYKVVRLSNATGELLSIKNRETTDAA
jgi:hypothetical protein